MQTVVYERWYIEEQARNARRRGERLAHGNDARGILPSRRIDKRNPDPRTALATVIDASRDSYAALSRMLGRGDGYLRRFVTDGVPAALRPDEHRRLAEYFGLDERALGVRDLWAPPGSL